MIRIPRRWPLALTAVLLLLFAAHTAAWFWVADALQSAAAREIAQAATRGWTITSGPPVRGGWPLGANLTWHDIQISGGGKALGGQADMLIYTAGEWQLQTSLSHPTRADLVISGRQSLRLGGLPAVPFNAASMRASVTVSPGQPPTSTRLDAADLRVGSGTEAVSVAALTLSGTATDTHSLSFDASQITLPGAATLGLAAWPLGPTVQQMHIDATLAGAWPAASPTPPWTAWLSAWRAGGGTLAIDSLAMEWGPLDVAASATVAADETGQPTGAARLRVTGWSETADALATAGLVPRDSIKPAKAFLSLMARAPQPGARSELDLPLSLSGGMLRLGKVPVLVVPPLP